MADDTEGIYDVSAIMCSKEQKLFKHIDMNLKFVAVKKKDIERAYIYSTV